MKFLIDACVGHAVTIRLRSLGHDVVEATERGPGVEDNEILAWATSERRIVVTMDKDFGLLIFAHGAPHSGLVRLPHVRNEHAIRLMERVLSAYTDHLSQGAIITVQENRIRIALPPFD